MLPSQQQEQQQTKSTTVSAMTSSTEKIRVNNERIQSIVTSITLESQAAEGGNSEQNDNDEIVQNLSTMRFDAGISELVAIELLSLRRRSQLLTANIVAHAVFTVSILSEVKRRVCDQSMMNLNHHQNNKNKQRNNKLKVGIIGCGRLGTHLVKALLEFTPLASDDITISTRRGAETLIEGDFKARGVICPKKNKSVVTSDKDVVFFMFPPAELLKVTKEIQGMFHKGCLVYSILAGVNAKRIAYLIDHEVVFKPEYTLRTEEYLNETEWNYECGVTGLLAINEFKELTCPLAIEKEIKSRVVSTGQSLLCAVFLQSLNVCERYHSGDDDLTSTEETFWLCNRLLFGDRTGFSLESFRSQRKTNGKGEYYTLTNHTTLLDLVDESTKFCRHFEKHYKTVFDRFVDWTDCYR